jgi:hypothetical protein
MGQKEGEFPAGAHPTHEKGLRNMIDLKSIDTDDLEVEVCDRIGIELHDFQHQMYNRKYIRDAAVILAPVFGDADKIEEFFIEVWSGMEDDRMIASVRRAFEYD